MSGTGNTQRECWHVGGSLKVGTKKAVRMTPAFGVVVVAVFLRRGQERVSRFGRRMQLKCSVLDTLNSKCQGDSQMERPCSRSCVRLQLKLNLGW